MIKSDSKIRFFIYTIALIPFIGLLGTGMIMLRYHTGAPVDTLFWQQDGHFWRALHQVFTIITTPLIILHLFVKTDWVKNLLKLNVKGRFKTSNIILFVTFLICALTAFCSWFIFDDPDISSAIGGIHNKFGILLIILFGIHIWNYRKLIIQQFKNV